MRSESVKEIATALSNFQGMDMSIKKDKLAKGEKFSYKYVTLDAIMDAISESLTKCGLAITQTMDITNTDKPINVLETNLLHISGEWLSGRQILNPVKDDPQSMGSAITYARRYGLCAILGIVADEDDDANTATKPAHEVKAPVKPVSPTVETPPKSETIDGITLPQTKKIHATAKEKQLSAEEARAYMQKTFKKNSTKELTKDEASTMIEFLNEIKPGEGHLVRAAKEMEAKEE